ncbi:MAG: hypothetical protein J6P60_02665 [Lachnospiraceae bacterium]|nr:hypothetical protein [Lachnospiraceae bacterium]
MPKQFFKRRYKCMIVLCHVIIFTLLIGVASDLFGHCLLEDNSGSLIFVDPLRREDDYTTSDAYRYAFGTDSSRLVKYLAVCRQFESNGEFDKDKEVDILEYYTHKSTDRRLTSNGLLRYRIQDLINWNNSYGFETLDDECLREVFLPTDGVSIYLKKERLKELLSGLSDVQSVPEDEVLSGQQILVEEQEEAYAEEDVAADPAMADQVTKLVGNILMEVSGDLAYNYSLYEEWKDYYLSSGTNFKYLYLPQNDEVDGKQSFYSNLGLKDRKEAVAVSRRFAGCMDVYLVIDAASGNIEEKSKAVLRGELQAGLSTYNYVFREHGGRIYIGVLKEGENSIAKYHEDDMYAMIDDCYRFFARYENQYLALLLGLLVLSLVTLAAFMIQCGRVEEDEQIHLIAFDRWYTEIAF